MPLLVDAHQDLAYNMLTFSRDYRFSAAETRQRELGSPIPERNGDTLLGWPDFQRGQVALIFSTLFVAPAKSKMGQWDIQCYTTPDQARQLYREQLDAYHRLTDENPDLFRLVRSQPDLENILGSWQDAHQESHPVGLVVLMEGAEGVRNPVELSEWWQLGVRIIGPAWAGTRFCGGTRDPGPLTPEGYQLLDGMAEQGFSLDLSHMDSQAALQALDTYPGGIIASHSNALRLLKGYTGNRHLPDEVISGLIERQGVIGVVPLNSFLHPEWRRGDDRGLVSLQHLVAQIDFICQMASSAQHVGLGTDFDGGFGVQSVPVEIDTIADLQQLAPLLTEKGYSDQDIAAIFGGNWIHFLCKHLPEA